MDSRYLIILLFLSNFSFSQCEYEIGDSDSNGTLDIIDIIYMVDFIIDNDFNSNNSFLDLNSDNMVNIVDIVSLINRIFYESTPINILNVDYDFNNLELTWNQSYDEGFALYNIYYSNIVSDENILIHSSYSKQDTSIVLTGINLSEQNWFFIGEIDFMGCEISSDQYLYDLPYKNYDIDSLGNVINHSFSVNDFNSALDCQSCHLSHYEEWSQSMHSYTAHSPVFFSYKEETLENHPAVGDKFCTQCHNPVSYLTNTDLSDFNTVEEFQSSNLHQVIKEGISCDVCHSVTGLSETVHTSDSGAASALYKLYPGENIKFGSIENPESNSFHDSYYLPTYNVSEQCLPCHDLVVRDVEAEITFTEWDRIPGFSMFGGIPCQSCHMPEKEDGTHDHTFIGVDMDLSIPYLENPLYDKINDLFLDSVELRYEIWNQILPASISALDTLVIPITVESLTAHSMPSGTSFNREAWLEVTVSNNDTLLYSSGLISENTDLLNYNDESLLLFRSFLKDENGENTNSVIDTYDIVNNSLPAYSLRFKSYNVDLPDDISGELVVSARMLFRPFNPEFLAAHHEPFLDNLPVFEMYSIESIILID